MTKKLLVETRAGKEVSRSIEIFDDPAAASTVSAPLAWKILTLLAEKPTYPNDLARKMRVHEQKVYYHVRRLLAAGLLEVIGETRIKGAAAKILAPTADAFGFELPSAHLLTKRGHQITPHLKEFFLEFVKKGAFDGTITVGAPTPHGPYNTFARDGFYVAHLAMFLGEMCAVPPDRFVVRTDIELKSERKEKRNLILVGGPVVNTVVADITASMKVRMEYRNNHWVIVSDITGKVYDADNAAMIAKIKNPWDESKRVLVLAGRKVEGTKTCMIALTQQHEKILKNYDRNKDFYRVIEGLDMDGDGQVDNVEVLE